MIKTLYKKNGLSLILLLLFVQVVIVSIELCYKSLLNVRNNIPRETVNVEDMLHQEVARLCSRGELGRWHEINHLQKSVHNHQDSCVTA